MVGVMIVLLGAIAGILPVFFCKDAEKFEHQPEDPFDQVENPNALPAIAGPAASNKIEPGPSEDVAVIPGIPDEKENQ